MQLTVLAVPGGPSVPVPRDRLAAVLDGRAGVSVSQQVVSDEGEAAGWGMRGSPTLLIDGVGPFAEPGQAPSMSCRLYRDENGQTSGAPSVAQLRQAIDQAPAAAADPGDPAWLDSLGRAGRGRIAPAERGLRAVHQAVLRSFVHAGAAPGMPSLAKHAAPFEVSQVLAELADGDFVCLDQAGQITAAYPFSALPTRHRVRISGAATVFAMCAIDAWACPRWPAFRLLSNRPIRPPATRSPCTLTGPPAPGIRPQRWCTSAGPAASAPVRRRRCAAGI
jgi:hypothetical protein